jgi:hypothetical protein
LADIKESNPVEVAEYDAAKSLLNSPAFVWWAPRVLQKRTRIIAAETKRYHKRTHKFEIEVPKSGMTALVLTRKMTTLYDRMR